MDPVTTASPVPPPTSSTPSEPSRPRTTDQEQDAAPRPATSRPRQVIAAEPASPPPAAAEPAERRPRPGAPVTATPLPPAREPGPSRTSADPAETDVEHRDGGVTETRPVPAAPLVATLPPSPPSAVPAALPAGDEGPVVRIHIGRIDIRGPEPAAVPSLPGPVADAPPAPPVLSLSDYLAGGGR